MSEPPCFFVGLHHPAAARHFVGTGQAVFISVNALRNRRSDFAAGDWVMDSGAFTEVSTHGRYRDGVKVYAEQIRRWSRCGNLLAAVSQDYMCEPHILAKTGLTLADHQRLTIERYDALLACDLPVYVMPVLQGYAPEDYTRHVLAYGDRLTHGMWVGVGSVCKRNGSPAAVARVLAAIRAVRPDLRLHGFGLKLTALGDEEVRSQLATSDSMAWSYAARREGRNANCWREALSYCQRVAALLSWPAPRQLTLALEARP